MTYTADEVNAAIAVVETAKQNHPRGWRCLDEVGLDPSDSFVRYAFANADSNLQRMAGEDPRIVYATGWLQGLAIGANLPRREP